MLNNKSSKRYMTILFPDLAPTEPSQPVLLNLGSDSDQKVSSTPVPVVRSTSKPILPQKSNEFESDSRKFRMLGGIPFLVDETLLKVQPLSNPAVAILGCSRIQSIRDSLSSVLNLKGVEDFTIYVSLGCPDIVSRSVFVHLHFY